MPKVCNLRTLIWLALFFLPLSALRAQTQATSLPELDRQAAYLIEANQLAASVDEVDVLDVRRREAFAGGHIQGSRWVDLGVWRQETAKPDGLQRPDFWSQQLSALGVSNARPVVIVGDSLSNTARLWWLLKYFGLRDVRLLNGGYSTWRQGNHAQTTDVTTPPRSDFKVQFQKYRLADIQQVLPVATSASGCRILDNRSDSEYTGARAIGPRGGHIPGATHLEWTRFLSSDGKFLKADEIRKLLADEGLSLKDSFATHCQTGGRSSVAAFALEMAGGTRIQNYYRGWSEYAAYPDAPVAK